MTTLTMVGCTPSTAAVARRRSSVRTRTRRRSFPDDDIKTLSSVDTNATATEEEEEVIWSVSVCFLSLSLSRTFTAEASQSNYDMKSIVSKAAGNYSRLQFSTMELVSSLSPFSLLPFASSRAKEKNRYIRKRTN